MNLRFSVQRHSQPPWAAGGPRAAAPVSGQLCSAQHPCSFPLFPVPRPTRPSPTPTPLSPVMRFLLPTHNWAGPPRPLCPNPSRQTAGVGGDCTRQNLCHKKENPRRGCDPGSPPSFGDDIRVPAEHPASVPVPENTTRGPVGGGGREGGRGPSPRSSPAGSRDSDGGRSSSCRRARTAPSCTQAGSCSPGNRCFRVWACPRAVYGEQGTAVQIPAVPTPSPQPRHCLQKERCIRTRKWENQATIHSLIRELIP